MYILFVLCTATLLPLVVAQAFVLYMCLKDAAMWNHAEDNARFGRRPAAADVKAGADAQQRAKIMLQHFILAAQGVTEAELPQLGLLTLR